MSAQDNRRIVEQFWAAVNANDWDAHDRLIDDGYVQDGPSQASGSGGRANSRAIKENYPTGRTPTLRRIIGAGDLWIMETTIDYGSEVAQGVHVLELREGRILRETDYFSQPFEPPAWRAQWVERM